MQPLNILFEDNHLIAVNKAPGVLVQGDLTGDLPLVDIVKEFLKIKYDKPGQVFAGLVHRIDRPVSGVVLFAKTSKALARMNKIFHDREVEKTYLAIVVGNIPHTGDLVHWITKDEKTNKTKVFNTEQGGAKLAKLTYRVVSRVEQEALVEIKPHTGRSHQIRSQMAILGFPIKGDLKYGFDKPNTDKSICLHAHMLSFMHPVQKVQIVIQSPIPTSEEWNNFLSI